MATDSLPSNEYKYEYISRNSLVFACSLSLSCFFTFTLPPPSFPPNTLRITLFPSPSHPGLSAAILEAQFPHPSLISDLSSSTKTLFSRPSMGTLDPPACPSIPTYHSFFSPYCLRPRPTTLSSLEPGHLSPFPPVPHKPIPSHLHPRRHPNRTSPSPPPLN